VRSESYDETLRQIRSKVIEFKLPVIVDYCEWGEGFGIDFDGLSLPDPPKRNAEEAAQAYRWEYLQIDPLFDLRLWCTPAAEPAPQVLGKKGAAMIAWENSVSKYTLQPEKNVALCDLLRSTRRDISAQPALFG
jgi:hypothetical protein